MRYGRALGVAAAAAAAAGVLGTAAPASAEPNPPGCPKGYFCAYAANDQRGAQLVRSWGNWNGSVEVGSVFNNGLRDPGSDHVQLTWTYNGRTWSRCLHYNPGPGEYKINFVSGVVIKSATWRGECPARAAGAPAGSGVRH